MVNMSDDKNYRDRDHDDDKDEKKLLKDGGKVVAAKPVLIEDSQPLPPPLPALVLPRLYVTKSALAEMNAEVMAHADIETAWGLYGFRFPHAIFVVGVLRPAKGEVVRGYANAEAGGQEMANAMRWLHANDRLINKTVKAKNSQDGKFGFLYKGHSHHTLGFKQYSGTDQSSILEAVQKDRMEVAIGPLAMINTNTSKFYGPPWSNEVSVSRATKVSFLFYMLTREMVEVYGYREAVIVRPIIVESIDTLLIPPLGWEFVRDDDFKEQLRHLASWDCKVTVQHVDANGKPPLEIQFIIDRGDFKSQLVITTDWNYPETAPSIMLIPKNGWMSMAEANRQSKKTWWKKGDDFIDIIGRMVKEGCL
jgi:hypothetical protein